MKTLLTSLSLLLLTSFLHAQGLQPIAQIIEYKLPTSWDSSLMYLYSYNEQDQNTETNQLWYNSTDSSWNNEVIYEYLYDASGNIVQQTTYLWNVALMEWGPLSRNSYSYSADSKLISTRYEKNSTGWENNLLDSSVYDANGDEVLKLKYKWDKPRNEYYLLQQKTFTYYGPGNLEKELLQNYDTATKSFMDIERMTYFYIQDMDSIVWERFDASISWYYYGQWKKYRDSNDVIQSQVFQGYDSTLSMWVDDQRVLFTYHSDGRKNQDFEYTWESSPPTWREIFRYTFIYLPWTGIPAHNPAVRLIAFPNPTMENVNIIVPSELLGKQYNIYHSTGQLIHSGTFGNLQSTIDLSGWSKGTYLLVAQSGNKMIHSRIVKQ